MKKEIGGNQCLIVTPLKEDESVDAESTGKMLDFIIGQGVHGVLAQGSTGEGFLFDTDERKAFADLVVSQVNGRVPVGFCVESSSTAVSVELSRHAEKAGADYLFTTAPYRHPQKGGGIFEHFKAIHDAADLPIAIYDGGAGVELGLDLLEKISNELPRIKYCKIFLEKPEKIAQIMDRCKGRIIPWAGHDRLTYLMLCYGAYGMTSAASCISDRWDLTQLVNDPVTDIAAQLADLESKVVKREAGRSTVTPSMSSHDFLTLLQLSEEIAQGASRLGAYTYLRFSENTKDADARSLKTRVEEQLTGLTNRLLFFELWWQGVDDVNAARLMADAGDLRYHLETIRRFKPHTLSEPEEKILNLKNVTGRSAVHTLYDVVTNGFTFTMTVSGKKKTVNREELMTYVRNPKAPVRQAAYQELYRVFATQRDLLGEIYKALVNDLKSENLGLRRFSSPIASRNLSNDVPDQAVDVLLASCAKNADNTWEPDLDYASVGKRTWVQPSRSSVGRPFRLSTGADG